MPKNMPAISYSKEGTNPVVDSSNSSYKIPFYKSNEYFTNYDSYINFIKATERLVRSDDRYKKYIAYLKNEVHLNRCQVLKGVTTEDEGVTIELHHGPIFTLFDYCAIILEYFLIKDWKISTYRIADAVLTEHQKNRIQCVMVSATVHEEIHAGNIFIPYTMAYGDLASFIKKYNTAISPEYKDQVNRYIDRSLLYDPNDFGVLDLNPELYKKGKSND